MSLSTRSILVALFLSVPALSVGCEDTQEPLAGSPTEPDAFDAGDEGRDARATAEDASVDAGAVPEDAGPNEIDASVADAGLDAGGVSDAGEDADAGAAAPGWQAEADVVVAKKPKRTTMAGTPSGGVLLAYRDSLADETLRVARWHGNDTGLWIDLGVANVGVLGALETGADPEERFVGLASAGAQRVVMAFRQNGAVYANVHSGAAWGAPALLSAHPSAVAVAGDGKRHAVVAYRTAEGRVGARMYDAITEAWSAEKLLDPDGFTADPADKFCVEAAMSPAGDALVLFRSASVPQSSSRDVLTARYSAGDKQWTTEQVGALSASLEPERLCLAMNASGAAVASLRERFTNNFGTFTRTRASYRASGATTWGTWASFDGTTFHDGCAVSDEGSALVTTFVSIASGNSIVPQRHTGAAWSTGTSIATSPTAGGSRFIPAMATGGAAAGAFYRTDNELVLFRRPAGGAWTPSDGWTRANPIGTSLDQHFKGARLLDDGRFLWVYQDSDGALRYRVHR